MLQKPLQHTEHGFGQTVKDMYVGSLDTRNTHTTQATVIPDEYLVRMRQYILFIRNAESTKHPCMEQLTASTKQWPTLSRMVLWNTQLNKTV